jgi:hypothetical protein
MANGLRARGRLALTTRASQGGHGQVRTTSVASLRTCARGTRPTRLATSSTRRLGAGSCATQEAFRQLGRRTVPGRSRRLPGPIPRLRDHALGRDLGHALGQGRGSVRAIPPAVFPLPVAPVVSRRRLTPVASQRRLVAPVVSRRRPAVPAASQGPRNPAGSQHLATRVVSAGREILAVSPSPVTHVTCMTHVPHVACMTCGTLVTAGIPVISVISVISVIPVGPRGHAALAVSRVRAIPTPSRPRHRHRPRPQARVLSRAAVQRVPAAVSPLPGIAVDFLQRHATADRIRPPGTQAVSPPRRTQAASPPPTAVVSAPCPDVQAYVPRAHRRAAFATRRQSRPAARLVRYRRRPSSPRRLPARHRRATASRAAQAAQAVPRTPSVPWTPSVAGRTSAGCRSTQPPNPNHPRSSTSPPTSSPRCGRATG